MSLQLKQSVSEDQHLLIRKGLRKFCPICGECRPIVMFGICRARKDGRNLYCKGCTRQKVYEFRQRHKDYRAAENRRKRDWLRLAEPRAEQSAPPATPLAPLSVTDQVLAILRVHPSTQRQIQKATGLSLDAIDIALTELRLYQRAIGSQVASEHSRIYFCL